MSTAKAKVRTIEGRGEAATVSGAKKTDVLLSLLIHYQ